MVYHVVILKARTDLSEDERRAFIDAFRQAVTAIESVRGVQLGARLTHGASYEQRAPDTADILGIIEFEDLASLQAYLRHPAHQELGARFARSFSSAVVYDFDVGGLEKLEALR